MLTNPIVGTFGPILFGVAGPSDFVALDELVNDLRAQTDTLALVSDQKWQQYDNATDRKIKRSLWKEYDELWNEYKIMRGWLCAAMAARTFAERGFKSSYLDVQLIPVVDDGALTDIDFSR